MDDCKNCQWLNYCKHDGQKKYYNVNPCELLHNENKNLLRLINNITEDLDAQYN